MHVPSGVHRHYAKRNGYTSRTMEVTLASRFAQHLHAPMLVMAGMLSACGTHHVDGVDTTHAAQVALGERLFMDPHLSRDGRVSCASCHRPDRAFTDGRPVSVGIGGQAGTRNAPSLLDASVMTHFFWDGRESALGTVVLQPFTNPVEMGLDSKATLLQRLSAQPTYRSDFGVAFPDDDFAIRAEQVATALTAYLNSLQGRHSAYDRYRAGAKKVLTSDQQAGVALFAGPAGCADCHRLDGNRVSLTDHQFHHLGVGDESIVGHVAGLLERLPAASENMGSAVLSDADIAGLGRFAVTRKPADLAAFRTPSLRNVAVTPPYMHNGDVPTLEAAVEHEIYYRSLSKGQPLSLTVDERRQLIAFLRTLTGEQPAAAPKSDRAKTAASTQSEDSSAAQ